jgi:nucleoside phosphorylase
MRYEDLIQGIERSGSTIDDVFHQSIGVDIDAIRERVVIAPWWEPHVFSGLGEEIRFISASERAAVKVWDISTEAGEITYVKTGIGAPVLADTLLALGSTSCKKAVFVGSAGALDPGFQIGDIVIPECGVSGNGVSRYLKGGALAGNDSFGEQSYPNREMYQALVRASHRVCMDDELTFHSGKIFSIDTIFAQFVHLEEIIGLGCNTIDMETASAFRAAAITGISLGALLSVSDNPVRNKTLFSGRDSGEMHYRKKVRSIAFPRILREVLQ